MAAARALTFSKFKLCSFDQLRFLAFPTLLPPERGYTRLILDDSSSRARSKSE